MGKSRCKSRKHKGGNPQPVPVDCAKVPCPTLTGAGGNLSNFVYAGTAQQKTSQENQTAASKHLASGGGKKKRVVQLESSVHNPLVDLEEVFPLVARVHIRIRQLALRIH